MMDTDKLALFLSEEKKRFTNDDVHYTPGDFPNFLDAFFTTVFRNMCSCPQKECNVILKVGGVSQNAEMFAPAFYARFRQYLETPGTLQSARTCNRIKKSISESSDMDAHIIGVLWMLDKYKIITERKQKLYLLDGHKRLTWKNVKSLGNKDAVLFSKKHPVVFKDVVDFFGGQNFPLYIQCIVWYFRKMAVDALANPILNEHDVAGISVGSTNITSDYDITLYGESFEDISMCIKEFQLSFKSVFYDSSNAIFDTNMYGVSFINISDKYFYTSPSNDSSNDSNYFEHSMECNSKRFKYVRSDKDTIISQHIWAFAKLLLKLEYVQTQNESAYSLLKETLDNGVQSTVAELLRVADEFVNEYPPQLENYDRSIKSLKSYQKDQTLNALKPSTFNNYISFVNYNGSETYFSRGTFLHVVVEMQMCNSGPKPSVALDNDGHASTLVQPHEYLDSFIENLADLIEHNSKEKYLVRALDALKKMHAGGYYTSEETQRQVEGLLLHINKLQTLCDVNILQCVPFVLMHECLKAIIKVANDTLVFDNDSLQSGIRVFNNFVLNLPDIKKQSSFTL